MPFALQLPLLTLGMAAGYKEGVREAIMLGGCSSSRATFFGACSAALGSPVPPEWTDKLQDPAATQALAHQLAQLYGENLPSSRLSVSAAGPGAQL